MIKEITLHRDDLEEILKITDQMNPADDNKMASGLVTIRETGGSGIGTTIEMIVSVNVNGHSGSFVKEISGVENW